MPTVIMPKMGDAMEEGTLLRWLKQVGEEVQAGDPIAEIETDKVSLEIEAADSGVLSQTLVAEGAVVPIGTPIATIGEEVVATAPAAAEAAPAAAAAVPAPEAAAANGRAAAAPAPVAAAAASAPAPVAPAAPGRGDGERMRASPLVKRLAAEHGIDLGSVAGTGPGGRIVRDDIAHLLTGAPAPAAAVAAPSPAPAAAPGPAPATAGRAAPTTTELSRIRKTTGQRMAESKREAPHFYVTAEVDMGPAAALREQLNAAVGDDGATKVSFNDLIVKAAANALRGFPNLNSALHGDRLTTYPNIDINVAVALDGGLIAPFVADADQKSLGAIARATKDLIGRARNGGLKPEEYQGGTFTISNLGMFDVGEFIAVINPPQAAILAVASIKEVPVVKDGVFAVGQRMNLTLSADHRVTDGAEAARYLAEVRRQLEQPMLLLLG